MTYAKKKKLKSQEGKRKKTNNKLSSNMQRQQILRKKKGDIMMMRVVQGFRENAKRLERENEELQARAKRPRTSAAEPLQLQAALAPPPALGGASDSEEGGSSNSCQQQQQHAAGGGEGGGAAGETPEQQQTLPATVQILGCQQQLVGHLLGTQGFVVMKGVCQNSLLAGIGAVAEKLLQQQQGAPSLSRTSGRRLSAQQPPPRRPTAGAAMLDSKVRAADASGGVLGGDAAGILLLDQVATGAASAVCGAMEDRFQLRSRAPSPLAVASSAGGGTQDPSCSLPRYTLLFNSNVSGEERMHVSYPACSGSRMDEAAPTTTTTTYVAPPVIRLQLLGTAKFELLKSSHTQVHTLYRMTERLVKDHDARNTTQQEQQQLAESADRMLATHVDPCEVIVVTVHAGSALVSDGNLIWREVPADDQVEGSGTLPSSLSMHLQLDYTGDCKYGWFQHEEHEGGGAADSSSKKQQCSHYCHTRGLPVDNMNSLQQQQQQQAGQLVICTRESAKTTFKTNR